nr:MAG TPA: hypothetical protein [Caudoviricetes sp.]
MKGGGRLLSFLTLIFVSEYKQIVLSSSKLL